MWAPFGGATLRSLTMLTRCVNVPVAGHEAQRSREDTRMAETSKMTNGNRSMKVPEFLREPLEAAQARIEQIEVEAQRVLKDLVERGRSSRKDLEQIVQRLSKQDWTFPEMKHRIDKLRE